MPPDGKFADGLRGFPTPNYVPTDGGYIVFKLPKANEWAGLILGAAQELAKEYNWYQWGDMTPEEAAEAFREIVNQAPYDTCGCQYPNGSRVLRLSEIGRVEQLTDGDWTDPTDDYEIPPVPARTEPTCEERRCAAAANAVNVLEMLYEEVSDAIAGGATQAEALAVLIGAAVIIIGGWLGLVLAALVTAIVAAFVGFVELAAMLGTDVWGEDFSDKLKCYLYECSSCDGDVVTFDFQCVRDKMATYVDVLDINFITNLRLFGQVDFILNVIGVDGLNAAGATTAIVDPTCDECSQVWCYVAFFEETDGGFVPDNCGGVMGNWTTGVGWEASDVGPCGGVDRTILNMSLIFDFPVTLDTVDMHYDYIKTTSVPTTEGIGLWVDNFANPLFTVDQSAAVDGMDIALNVSSGIPDPVSRIDVFLQPTYGGTGGTGRVIVMQLTGHEEKPTFLEALGWIECP